MNKITKNELNRKIELHKKWLEDNPGGEPLVLIDYDLNGSDLRGSDLRGSDLRGSDLRYSDLRYSNLRYSNLSGSDLRGCDLSGSDLRYSDLRYSNLRGSDLRGSDLRYSDLRDSNLKHSDLRGSNLRGSDFDYSCFPLWCGGSNFRCDLKLVYQLLAHIFTFQCEEPEFSEIKEKILPYAKKSHRATNLGLTKQ